MASQVFCAFSFCAVVLNRDYKNYEIEVNLESLQNENNMVLYDLQYLNTAVNVNIKMNIEDKLQKEISLKISEAQRAIAALEAKEKGTKSKSDCYGIYKKETRIIAETAFEQIEPCLLELNNKYVYLVTSLRDAIKRAEELQEQLLKVRNLCDSKEEGNPMNCVNVNLNNYTESLKVLTELFNGYNSAFQDALKSLPQAKSCISANDSKLSNDLNIIVEHAAACGVE